MSRSLPLPLWCFVLFALGVGCAKDLTSAWEVKQPRLILARVEIEGDTEGRTRPRVGEPFDVRAFLAYVEPPTRLDFAASLCFSVTLPTGDVVCVVEEPLADLSVDYAGGTDVVLRSALFALPQEAVAAAQGFGKFGGVSLLSAACVDGRAERIPGTDATKDRFTTLFRCVDNDDSKFKEPLLFTFSINFDFGDPGQLNHRPIFACTDDTGACAEGVAGTPGAGIAGPIVFQHDKKDDADPQAELWAEGPDDVPAPNEECMGVEGIPTAVGGREYIVRVRADPSDRESYVRTILQNSGSVSEDTREDLLLSEAFTSHGGGSLDSFSSLIDRGASDGSAEAEITYTAPKQSDEAKKHIPDGGKLVKFFFAMRDGRGGVDYTTRALCLVPPPLSP